jgi:DNA repair protein RAD5
MIDCPEALFTGADLIVSLNVYVRPSAFVAPSTSSAKPSDTRKVVFNEGQETLQEQQLRERKMALLKLFDAVGLRPKASKKRGVTTPEGELKHEDVLKMTQKPPSGEPKGKRVEVVGDGEEVEVEDEEGELSENQLDVIYRKCVSFTLVYDLLTLHPERKQTIGHSERWNLQTPSR